jgi:hypothetical protein
MTTYPTGVAQNHAAPGNPADLRPVGEQNWRMFATLKDAQSGLEMIQTASPDAFMVFAQSGQYSQFVYLTRNPSIRVRLAYGTAVPAEGGEPVLIQEFPSDIFDRHSKPQPFIDSVEPGKTPQLKCREIAPGLGELYWTTA